MLAHIKLKKMFKFLNENITEYVIASIRFNLFYVIIFYIVAFDLCSLVATYVNLVLGISLIFIISMIIPFVLFTQLASIGISDDELLIIHLKLFRIESKKIYNIPIEKIRSITVRKFLFNVSLNISFISEDGILEKKKYKFGTFVIGSAERKEYALKVYEKLMEIQKVIDKGDF